MGAYIFGIGLSVMGTFLVLLVLVQRGRGGGLSGALGGVGGSSAFGAKAGDVFTKITVVAATVWIVSCVGAAYWAGHRGDLLGASSSAESSSSDTATGDAATTEEVLSETAPAETAPAAEAPETDASAEATE